MFFGREPRRYTFLSWRRRCAHAVNHFARAQETRLADVESSNALLRDCVWMGLARLVSCRAGIRRSKAHPPECASSSLYMHSDSRTIFWMLSYSPFGNRQLESRSPVASKPPAMAMVADGATSPDVH